MFRRIVKFDKQDWNHMKFLFFNMLKQFCKGDFHESKEAYYWMKIHLTYNSKRVN